MEASSSSQHVHACIHVHVCACAHTRTHTHTHTHTTRLVREQGYLTSYSFRPPLFFPIYSMPDSCGCPCHCLWSRGIMTTLSVSTHSPCVKTDFWAASRDANRCQIVYQKSGAIFGMCEGCGLHLEPPWVANFLRL